MGNKSKSVWTRFPGNHTTVDEWMEMPFISDHEAERYPNARIAADLKKSPLAEVMSEEPEKTRPGYVLFQTTEPVILVNPKVFNGLLEALGKK